MNIRHLSSSIINKIAAGEVIERPANVIKELLENTFDANATAVKIEIEDAGLKRIKITDDGSGMSQDDIRLSWKRHTTSKITSEDDLFEIRSLGFRGEALASIAEVSHITIKSKVRENNTGNVIEVEGGILLREDKIGCPDGTIIEITNLFYNVPARKKFLKSPEVELAHIIDIVTRYALIRKDTAIMLYHNGKEIINAQRTKDLRNNVIFIYGTEIAKDLLAVYERSEDMIIEGFISRPNLTRANRNEQSLYINGRYVRSKVITDAIYDAYKTLLFTNRHPLFILSITMNAADLDVNIHPNKLDVRLKNEREVCEAVYRTVHAALNNAVLIPKVTPDTETKRQATQEYTMTREKQSNLFRETLPTPQPRTVADEEFTQTIATIIDSQEHNIHKQPEPQHVNKLPDMHVLGQINRTFIIAESSDGLAIIDQHAAEERVNYETFMHELHTNALRRQQLLEGRIIELTPVQFQAAINNREILERFGFDFEEFGGTALKLNTIPEIFGKYKATLFTDIINELTHINVDIIETEIEKRIIMFSCRASVKAGEELTLYQMKDLIQKLSRTKNPYSCPHGRPTIIQLTNADLEKKFKRTGW